MGLCIHSYQSRHRQTTSATAKLKIQTVINSKWFLGAGMNHCPYNVRSQSFLALLLLTTQERKLSSSFPVLSKLLVLLPFLKTVSQIITPDTLYVRSSWSFPPFTKNVNTSLTPPVSLSVTLPHFFYFNIHVPRSKLLVSKFLDFLLSPKSCSYVPVKSSPVTYWHQQVHHVHNSNFQWLTLWSPPVHSLWYPFSPHQTQTSLSSRLLSKGLPDPFM